MFDPISKMKTGKIKFEVEGYECLRCGHKWIPKLKEKPRVCPRCNSPYWDKSKKNDTKRK